MDKCDLRFEEFVVSDEFANKEEKYIHQRMEVNRNPLLSLFAEFCFRSGWEAKELEKKDK